MDTGPLSFKDATAVKAVDSHTYSGFLPDSWCIGSGEILGAFRTDIKLIVP